MRFDEQRADDAVLWFEGALVHTKGIYAGVPFILTDWQRDEIIRPLFGTLQWDADLEEWIRLYRLAWIELARKNGKSELMAGIALKLLIADGEEGAEIYGAAKDREQAGLVFGVALQMIRKSPILRKLERDGLLLVREANKRIVWNPTASFYQVIAADAKGSLGQDPHGICFDEVIAQPNRELWDALKTGMGSRKQPLMVAATTAGNDPTSFAATEHEFSERVLVARNAGEEDLDPARFVFMRNTPKDADWRDEANWYHANPALGDFLRIDVLRDEAKEAEANPATENRFRQFRLNQWVQQATRWLPLHIWDEVENEAVDLEFLKGKRCWSGLDLASSIDVTALVHVFPDDDDVDLYRALHRFWIPEEGFTELNTRTGGKAAVWRKDGFLTVTDGDVIDQRVILEQIVADGELYTIVEVAYDRWGMQGLSSELIEQGATIVPFGQGYASMSAPTKEWERLIRTKKYHHGGNPVMRWMVDNIVVRQDPAGNLKIDKEKSADKVDGPVASVMALARAQLGRAEKPSAWAAF